METGHTKIPEDVSGKGARFRINDALKMKCGVCIYVVLVGLHHVAPVVFDPEGIVSSNE